MKFKAFLTVLTVIVMGFATFVASGGLKFTSNTGFGSGSILIDAKLVGIAQGIEARADVTIVGTNITGECINPGGRTAPGQNPASINVSTVSPPVVADSNGNADINYDIDLVEASNLSGRDIGCPNGNWSVTNLVGDITVYLYAQVKEGNQWVTVDTDVFECNIDDANAFIQCRRA